MYLSAVKVYRRSHYGVGNLGATAPVAAKPLPVKLPPPAPKPVQAKPEDKQKEYVALFKKVTSEIPFPHPYFRSFIENPAVEPQPFYQGVKITDPEGLAKTNYFPNTKANIERDIAAWLYNNQPKLNSHVQVRIQQYVREKEKKAKKKAKKKKILGIVLAVVGGIASILTGGILLPAVIALVQVGFSVWDAKKGSKEALANAKKLMAFLHISPEAMEKFRLWIMSNAQRPPEVPPTPEGVQIKGRYLVFVEENLAAQSDSAEEAMQKGFVFSKVGDRVTLVDAGTNQVLALMLREEKGVRKIPVEKGGAVQALPKSSADKLAGKTDILPILLIGGGIAAATLVT